VLTGRNGDLFRIAPQPSVQRAVATVGVLGLIDGRAVTLGAPAASPAASEGIAARGGAVP
jgi:hypothetical protein